MMPFLYFPDNKLEYIPAGLVCMLFIIGAILTWRIFVKASKHEMVRFQEMEKHIHEINGTASSDASSQK